jgi:HEAT repeat protein
VEGLTALGTSDAVRELEWLAAGDPDVQVGGSAIAALGDIAARFSDGANAAIAALVALLGDPDRSDQAISAIIRLPPDRLPRVADGLAHPQLGVRRRTVDALARYCRPEATRLLQPAFNDDDPLVRETAAVAVMRIGTRAFDDTLRELAQNDGSKAVRRAAAAALARVRNAN